VLWKVFNHEKIADSLTPVPRSLIKYCNSYFATSIEQTAMEDFSTLKVEIMLKAYLQNTAPNLLDLTHRLFHWGLSSTKTDLLNKILEIFLTFGEHIFQEIIEKEYR